MEKTTTTTPGAIPFTAEEKKQHILAMTDGLTEEQQPVVLAYIQGVITATEMMSRAAHSQENAESA